RWNRRRDEYDSWRARSELGPSTPAGPPDVVDDDHLRRSVDGVVHVLLALRQKQTTDGYAAHRLVFEADVRLVDEPLFGMLEFQFEQISGVAVFPPPRRDGQSATSCPRGESDSQRFARSSASTSSMSTSL